jgi:hypothetical protein
VRPGYLNPKKFKERMNIRMSIAMSEASLPEILKAPDIACYLRISRTAAYELVHEPDFPALIFDRKIRIRRESFLDWLGKQEDLKPGPNK